MEVINKILKVERMVIRMIREIATTIELSHTITHLQVIAAVAVTLHRQVATHSTTVQLLRITIDLLLIIYYRYLIRNRI